MIVKIVKSFKELNKSKQLLVLCLVPVICLFVALLSLWLLQPGQYSLTILGIEPCNMTSYTDNSLNKMESVDNYLIIEQCIQKSTPCTEIEVTGAQNGNGIGIYFTPLKGENGCAQVVEHQKYRIKYGPLERGVYTVSINYKEQVLNSGKLTVT
jgi:hypothetical protein